MACGAAETKARNAVLTPDLPPPPGRPLPQVVGTLAAADAEAGIDLVGMTVSWPVSDWVKADGSSAWARAPAAEFAAACLGAALREPEGPAAGPDRSVCDATGFELRDGPDGMTFSLLFGDVQLCPGCSIAAGSGALFELRHEGGGAMDFRTPAAGAARLGCYFQPGGAPAVEAMAGTDRSAAQCQTLLAEAATACPDDAAAADAECCGAVANVVTTPCVCSAGPGRAEGLREAAGACGVPEAATVATPTGEKMAALARDPEAAVAAMAPAEAAALLTDLPPAAAADILQVSISLSRASTTFDGTTELPAEPLTVLAGTELN